MSHLIGGGGLALEAVVSQARLTCAVAAGHPEIGTPSVEADIDRLGWRPNANLSVQLCAGPSIQSVIGAKI